MESLLSVWRHDRAPGAVSKAYATSKCDARMAEQSAGTDYAWTMWCEEGRSTGREENVAIEALCLALQGHEDVKIWYSSY